MTNPPLDFTVLEGDKFYFHLEKVTMSACSCKIQD